MKRLCIAALVAVMTAVPLVASAQSKVASTKTHPAPEATMTGVVKSVDATSMVIARSTAKGPEESFLLNSSTARKGDLVPGDKVKVRYFLDNAKKVATAVTVTQAPGKKGQ